MHIVFVTGFFATSLSDVLSGMPGYIYKVSKCLLRRGHQVEIIAAAEGERIWFYKGIKIYEAQRLFKPEGNCLSISIAVLQREIEIQKRLKEIDSNCKIDLVQYAGWSGVGMLHSLRCPAVLRLSTYSKVQYKNNELFKKYTIIYSFYERLAGYRADAIIAPGKKIAQGFQKDIHKKVDILETPYIDEQIQDDSIAAEMGNRKYFLFYGTASKDKGFETLSKIIPRVLDKHKDVYFVIAGWDVQTENGSSIRILRDKLGDNRERCIYLGPLEHKYLYPVIAKASFVVIPSIIDNLPNSCLEALFLDKIVVGSKGSSIEQMVVDGLNGFLSIPGDAGNLLECVEKALNLTFKEMNVMIRNIQELRKPYTETVAIEKLERYYRSLLSEN